VTAGSMAPPRGLAVSVRGLTHSYDDSVGATPALRGIDLDVAAGDTVALLGPSGSGKTTLLTILAGLVRPTEGDVVVGAHRLRELSERRLLDVRRGDLAVLAQGASRNLLPYLTPAENLRFAMGPSGGRRDPVELLAEVALADRAHDRTAALSGGEQQRLGVAVALCGSPRVLLVDEPTSQLDSTNRDRVLELLLTAQARDRMTLITVTHDPAVSERLQREVHLRDGAVVSTRRRGSGRWAVGPLLTASDVGYTIGGRDVLDGVSLAAPAGQALVLTGPSGSGKTTLLALLAGLERPTRGRVRFGSADVVSPEVRSRFGFVLQSYALPLLLTAAECVEVVLQIRGVGRAEIRRRAAAVLERVDLTAVADSRIERLSGGQQQRVAVARALVGEPTLLLADEPTAELDRELREHVVAELLRERDRGAVVILTSHDEEVAASCDLRLRLHDGRPEAATAGGE